MDYYHVNNKYCSESGGQWGRWSYRSDFVTFNFQLNEIFYKPTPTTAIPPTTTTPNPNVQLGTTPFWYDYYDWDAPEEWHQPAGFEIHFRCVDDPWHNPTTTTQPTTEPPTTTTTEPQTTLNFNFVNGLDQEYLTIY